MKTKSFKIKNYKGNLVESLKNFSKKYKNMRIVEAVADDDELKIKTEESNQLDEASSGFKADLKMGFAALAKLFAHVNGLFPSGVSNSYLYFGEESERQDIADAFYVMYDFLSQFGDPDDTQFDDALSDLRDVVVHLDPSHADELNPENFDDAEFDDDMHYTGPHRRLG